MKTFFEILLSVPLAVGILIWAMRQPYLSTRWKGCGRRVFWYTIPMIYVAILVEAIAMLLIFIPFVDNFSQIVSFGIASLDDSIPKTPIVLFSLAIGIIEESVKYLGLKLGTRSLRRVQSLSDVVAYAMVAGCSFAIVENISYACTGMLGYGGAIARAVLSASVHVSTMIIIAVGIVRSRESGRKAAKWLHIGMAILLHAGYDCVLLLITMDWLAYLYAGFMLLCLLGLLYVTIAAPYAYAKRHSYFVCHQCNAQYQAHHEHCMYCGSSYLLHIVPLPKL